MNSRIARLSSLLSGGRPRPAHPLAVRMLEATTWILAALMVIQAARGVGPWTHLLWAGVAVALARGGAVIARRF